MTLAAIFLIVFIVGPLLFRQLTLAPTGRANMRFLTLFIAVCAGISLGIRFGLPQFWGSNLVLTGLGIGAIWFAWIGILAFGAQRLRQMDGGVAMRRWTAVLGAIGTTIPWFGLASADMLVG